MEYNSNSGSYYSSSDNVSYSIDNTGCCGKGRGSKCVKNIHISKFL